MPRGRGPISLLFLAVASANLNTRIRNRGLSSQEMWFQRDQFTNSHIPLSDLQLIRQQYSSRLSNHPASESSKAPGCSPRLPTTTQVHNLVDITSDASKTRAHDRYLVVSTDGSWCNLRKFTGSQLRSTSYRIKLSECYRVAGQIEPTPNLSRRYAPVMWFHPRSLKHLPLRRALRPMPVKSQTPPCS